MGNGINGVQMLVLASMCTTKGAMTIHGIADAAEGIARANGYSEEFIRALTPIRVAGILRTLRSLGRVQHDGHTRNVRAGRDEPTYLIPDARKYQAPAMQPTMPPPRTNSSEPAKPLPNGARVKIVVTPRPAQPKGDASAVKVATLKRLAQIVHPEIADVLDSIVGDYQTGLVR